MIKRECLLINNNYNNNHHNRLKNKMERPRRELATVQGRSEYEIQEVVLTCTQCTYYTNKKARFRAEVDIQEHVQAQHSKESDLDSSGAEEMAEERGISMDSKRKGNMSRMITGMRLLGMGFGEDMEKAFFEEYGAEEFRLLTGEDYIGFQKAQKHKKRRKQETETTEQDQEEHDPPNTVPSRVLRTRNLIGKEKIMDDEHDESSYRGFLTCKICKVNSYRVPIREAEKWLQEHQKTSDACLRLQRGDEEIFLESIHVDRKKRFRLFFCFVLHPYLLIALDQVQGQIASKGDCHSQARWWTRVVVCRMFL